VIAIEPDPVNLACLRRNLAAEIQSGTVRVVESGVWDSRGRLTLYENIEGDSAGMTFVGGGDGKRKIVGIPVFPLDDIVAQLQLTRVDFIKMDIEGSERQALAGGRETIRKFHPRMAVCSYHLHDDPEVIPKVVRDIEPSYAITAKDVESIDRWIRPKVLFFQFPGK
jgi:FkbM family methyltransferase